jgi:hypothetical protein
VAAQAAISTLGRVFLRNNRSRQYRHEGQYKEGLRQSYYSYFHLNPAMQGYGLIEA